MDACMQAGNPLTQVAVTCGAQTGFGNLNLTPPAGKLSSSTFGVNFSADPEEEAKRRMRSPSQKNRQTGKLNYNSSKRTRIKGFFGV